MVHLSAKDEAAAFRPVVDHQHLVRGKLDALTPLVIETVSARRVAHAHRDVIFACGQHEALIDPRWPVAGDARRRQTCLVNGAAIDIELDIDRSPYPRTI